MDNLKTKLADYILLREEGQNIILFNQYNDATVKITADLYKKIKKGYLKDTEENKKIIYILHQNRLLDWEQSYTSTSEKPQQSQQRTFYSPIMRLRSEINPINVLWAITSKCNLRCLYCFPDVKNVQQAFISLSLEEIDQITDQIIQSQALQVFISGGEPLLEAEKVWRIIEKLYKHNVKSGVLNNGTMINAGIIEKLKSYNTIVGISLDAHNEEINSITRGKGAFDKTVKGVKLLKQADIRTSVLITLSKYNFDSLEAHIKFLCDDMGINSIVIQDLRPFGSKIDYDKARLTMTQENKLYDKVMKITNRYSNVDFNLTELFLFPHSKYKTKKSGKIMQCPAGYNFAYIDFYGDMYPCTQLPTMKLGNVLQDGTITELWRSSKNMQKLRTLKTESICKIDGCADCSLNEFCDGGCRGEAVFSGRGLYGSASRCPKVMGIDIKI
ncbi:MAG: radical SAM protein [Gammaproteobacteria bacterium]|jgi:radical SAM protein with 4Fe4S-binding SPASM domain